MMFGHISNCLAVGLPFLQKLSLRQDSFSGPIPASLSCLSRLRSLFLQFNSLTGPLPPSLLTSLFHLQVFSATGNLLTGGVPTALPGSLRFLDLSSNALAGPLPDNLSAAAPSLQLLDLSFNRLRGTLPPPSPASIPSSTSGSTGTTSRAHIPAVLANCSSLLHLGLQGNDLQGILPATLPVMRSLQVLSLFLSRKPLPLTTSSAASTAPAHLETPALAIDHKLVVSGGRQLSGHVHISGSKNAALPILAGSLCCAAVPVVIRGVLNLSDTRTMAVVLCSVGVRVEEAGGGEVVVDASGVGSVEPSPDDAALSPNML